MNWWFRSTISSTIVEVLLAIHFLWITAFGVWFSGPRTIPRTPEAPARASPACCGRRDGRPSPQRGRKFAASGPSNIWPASPPQWQVAWHDAFHFEIYAPFRFHFSYIIIEYIQLIRISCTNYNAVCNDQTLSTTGTVLKTKLELQQLDLDTTIA